MARKVVFICNYNVFFCGGVKGGTRTARRASAMVFNMENTPFLKILKENFNFKKSE